MTDMTHHISDPLLAAYAAGNLARPFALVVATHVSLCPECQARLGAHQALGGAVLEALPGQAVRAGLKDDLMAMLDAPDPAPVALAAPAPRQGIYPGPLAEMLGEGGPRWRTLGLGTRQSILHDGADGSVRLLYIPPGQAVPDHGHGGLEMTLVLQGSFSDETGRFGVGDVEIAGEDLEHTPIAGDEAPCICLAATDAPLKFNSVVPRLLQRLFRI